MFYKNHSSKVNEFEKAWAKFNGYKYGVACNSGTNALFLALKALGSEPGYEVIVPEFTMIATAWAVSYTGAKPVFVDCDDNLIVRQWKYLADFPPKAIITVPIYGRSAPIPYFEGIPVIEDMAEGHGIKPRGTVACYSFYKNKIIQTGEGGMCLTNDKRLADEMRSLANMYFDKGRTYLHPKIGYNFRLTEYQAEQGLKQVKNFDNIIKKRRRIEGWWNKYLPKEIQMPPRDTVWMYDIDCGDKQEEIKKLIPMSRYFFKPMSMQPMYFNKRYKELNAYKWSRRGLYLPLWDLTEKEIIKVSKICKKYCC